VFNSQQMSLVDVNLLGPVELVVDGLPVPVRRKKQRALLALLALRAGEVVSTDRLVLDLWGETPPKAAVGSLQNLVSELRRLVGAELLVTRQPGYALELDPQRVDAHRFERAVREGTGLRDALELWRGAPLGDLAYEPFAAAEIGRLEELRAVAWEELFDLELAGGQHARLVPELERFIAEHPLRERPRAQLMLALYRSGRQADALEAYRQTRATLVDELGLEPSAELNELEQAILRHDPAVAVEKLASAAAEPSRRKSVTILFVDVVDSTELGVSLDPEVFRGVMTRYFAEATAAVERHGGVVEKFIGDAVMAVFGVPAVHEDDALRAARAAVELREAVGELSAELAESYGIALLLRIGLNSGEVLVGDPGSGASFATGVPVNVAMRLEQAALPGEILIGEATYALVRHAVETEPVDPVELGGALGRVAAVRLAAVGESVRPQGSAALVGRTDELAWLRAALAGVQAERRSRVVTVLGDGGVGKSRLAKEFVDTSGVRTLVGRCVSYGQGATFLPLAQIVRDAHPKRPQAAIAELLAGDEQAPLIAERVTQLTGPAEGAGSTGEIFWAFRRFLEASAGVQPLVVVLEDIHWAEATLLDLIEYLDAWTAAAPLLVLCLARKDLLDQRPGWGVEHRVLALDPLTDQAAGELLADIGTSLDETARARIVEVAEGNPLFLEQLLAFADEAGAETLASVPPTVEALLAARLDRLEPDERALIERAAVVGRDFSRSALVTLSPPEDLAGLDRRLASLAHRGLVRGLRGAGDDPYRFHHVLVRDVAYAAITKEVRSGLHERYATWLEQRQGVDEIVGYHFEQAHRYRSELRPGDPRLHPLAKAAGTHLATAGISGWKRADLRAAINLLGRATSLLEAQDDERAELLCELGIARRWSGDARGSEEALNEALAEGGDRRVALRARIELAYGRLYTDREADPSALLELIAEAIPVFDELGDDRGLGRAYRLDGYVRGSMQGRCADWIEASDRALVPYRRSGWSASGCLSELATALFHGPMPVPDAVDRCERLLEETADPTGSAGVLVFLGGLRALEERFDGAFEALAAADEIYRELGETYSLANNGGRIRGHVHRLAGDAAAAEGVFRECCETFERVNDETALATIAAGLGQSLYEQGRYPEATEWSDLAEARCPRGDIIAQFSWRSLKGKLLAQRGRLTEGEELVRDALAIVERTDVLSAHGEVLLDLAEVFRAAGRGDAAAERIEEALELFDRKGDTASARRARSLFADVTAV
jgi:DNA-binding SARP family transcriptional activator